MKTAYREVPAEAPTAVLWKCLGQVFAGVWVNYSLRSWHDELDVDLEAALRQELTQLPRGVEVVPDGFRLVRLADRRYPELLIQLVMLTEDDYFECNKPKGRRN